MRGTLISNNSFLSKWGLHVTKKFIRRQQFSCYICFFCFCFLTKGQLTDVKAQEAIDYLTSFLFLSNSTSSIQIYYYFIIFKYQGKSSSNQEIWIDFIAIEWLWFYIYIYASHFLFALISDKCHRIMMWVIGIHSSSLWDYQIKHIKETWRPLSGCK